MSTKDILNEIENEIFYQFKMQDSKPVYESRPQQLSDRIQLTLRLSSYDSDHLKLGPIKKALSKFGPVKQSTFKHDRLTSGRKEVTFEIGTAEDMNENLTQYYGVDKYGQAKFVAMSKEQVQKWAEDHPEDGIVEIEDSSGRKLSLTESLRLLDKREFEENSNTYELEMLYESVKTTLSAQQKNDLARFIRKAKTAEEVNTYMTGMLAQNQMNEGLKIQAYGKTKRIPKSLSNYMHTGKGREMDARFLEAAIEDTMYDDDGNYLGILDADKICRELNADKDFLYTVKPFKSTENNVRIIATDYNGNEDIISISKEVNESLKEDVDDDYFGREYEQNLNKIKDLAYDLEIALNDLDVWVDDVWYDGYDKTITVFVTNGDWKHDHWKLDNFLREWIDQNNLDADLRTNDLESDSDVYDAYHIIRFRSLNEGYVAQKPTRFTNGQVRDFDPYTFIKNIMRSGQSMNSVRDCGQDQYTIFVNYKDHFGPRGIDNPDTLYTIDIIKEDPSGEQTRELTETDLLWNEVAEVLQDWKEDKCLNEGITPINEAYSYRKVNKAILKAISDLGGECFETIDNNSCSYRFKGKVSRKALIADLSDALKSTGYTILSDNSGVEVQDNDNWWQGTNIEIYSDTDNQEKGYSFFIIGIYDLS